MLFKILNVSIIFLLNINTRVLSQSTNNNDSIINEVQTLFSNMQQKVQEYLQTFAIDTDIANVNSILAASNLNLTSIINKKCNCVNSTLTSTTRTTTKTTTRTTTSKSTTTSKCSLSNKINNTFVFTGLKILDKNFLIV
jgi:hypothetical protein